MEKMREQGWHLTEQGFDVVSDSGAINDLSTLIKRAADLDLREIGSGEGDISQGYVVLQIQKLRNVAAPKNNEESRSAPRMLKIYFTDGKNNYQAVEIEYISSISLNTPPGTKLRLRHDSITMSHGIILLKPSNIANIIGGIVPNLIEKWELNRKLASHKRVRSADESGPPPWIPFGKKIVRMTEQDRQFKALGEKDIGNKDNSDFEAQRQDAIAEAARQGSKKVFGGGTKQLLDHSVQRIVDQGFTIQQAEYALKVNRNNVERALKSLQRSDNKHNSRDTREPREPRGKRFEKKTEDTKPSSGKVSLFDFLEDKLPIQVESVEQYTPQYSNDNYGNTKTENQTDRYEHRGMDGHSSRGGRAQKLGRGGYQAPPRHSDDSKFPKRTNNENYNASQYGTYSGGNSQRGKPPRFQKTQESHVQQEHNLKTNQGKLPQNERKNHPFVREFGNFQKNQKNHSDNNRFYEQNNFESKPVYDAGTFNRHNQTQQQNTNVKFNNFSVNDKNYKQQMTLDTSNDVNNSSNRGGQKNSMTYNNSRSANVTSNGNNWTWKKGDQCMAKYWEDNKYYNAQVTAVSTRTCVVQFTDFQNFEEVLQVDCIPITEDFSPTFPDNYRRTDQRFGNRPPRYEGNFNAGGMEFRRGGGGGGGGGGPRGYNKKRGQQRSAQPIYQPPAQRR